MREILQLNPKDVQLMVSPSGDLLYVHTDAGEKTTYRIIGFNEANHFRLYKLKQNKKQ